MSIAEYFTQTQAEITALERSLIDALKFVLIEATPEMGYRTAEHRLQQAISLINEFDNQKEAIISKYERREE